MSGEKCSERSFFHNMTLGVVEQLKANEDVTDVEMKCQKPCDIESITGWEKKYSCVMPKDLKNFYLSLDGFELTWSFLQGGIIKIGCIHVNKLNDFKRIFKNKFEDDDPESLDEVLDILEKERQNVDILKPSFCNKNCKIFVLEETTTVGAICAVITGKISKVKIWLLDFSYQWHILAQNFSQYFRMMIYYQGVPEWQFLFTPYGLSPWAEQLMCMISPGLCSPPSSSNEWYPENVQLDLNLFKTRSKQTKQNKLESQQQILK